MNFIRTLAGNKILCLLKLLVVRTEKYGTTIHSRLRHVMDSHSETATYVSHRGISVNARKESVAVNNQAICLSRLFGGKSFARYMGAGKGFSAPLKTTEYNSLSRTGYGFYLHSISSHDLNVDLFHDSVLDFFDISGLIALYAEPSANQADNNKNSPKQQTAADSPECFGRLTKLGDGLKAYAKQNNGELPASLHTDGLNQLTELKALSPELFVCPDSGCNSPKPGVQLVNDNTGYVYFGSWKKGSSGKLPLIIDLPDSHNQYFHVLLLDGSVQKIGLEMQMSIKRMASTLHTVFKYSEEEFQELIRRAELLDKKLEKESQ